MDKQPTIFEFTSYKFEPALKRVLFSYKQEFVDSEPLNFTETLLLPEVPNLEGLPEGLVDKVLQGVHLILGVSYYKSYCATKLKIPYVLSQKEATFWNVVYKKGLGEFYYRNNLDHKISPKFSYNKNVKDKNYFLDKNGKCLVAISGGRDSIVAAELLKYQGIDITAFFTETQKESTIVNKTIEILGVKSLKFRRVLDEKVFQNHKYNGHVPVSAMFAFLGILYAVLYRCSYCIMANEHSSNFGNVKHKGLVINHQWSKSSEFESMFCDYVNNFITPDVRYFSLLRPFYEIRIAELFSKYKQYFSFFSSCNKNFRIAEDKKSELWCGQCPKCVFVFTLLSVFLSKDELLGIFKKNLYQDANLLPLFKDILGFGKLKPFDCVGTFEESKAAFALGAKKFKNDFIIKTLLPKVKIKKNIISGLFKTHQANNIPSQFRFLGMKNILILGYGREGEVTKKYIKKNYSNLKIGIADLKFGKNYLEKQKDYDMAVKTPGIAKSFVKIPYTTATNIFFSKNKNTTVGITGSKGKSTTASLIYSLLKEAGKNVRILGNIGNPMLSVLSEPIEENEIFVLELSSYQLDDIDFSPNIAVVTNLFPEHMDYHGGLDNYYNAKKNIIRFQNKTDTFVYNQKNEKLRKWVSDAKGGKIPFSGKIDIDNLKIPLLGHHNRENIGAAIAVARIFNISDEIIEKAIEKFRPLPHRLEFVGEFKNIKFYNDAISTTPESTVMAIKSLKNVGTIFLGGEDRGYNFSQLEKTIKKYRIKNAVLFPNSGKRIFKSQKGLNILKTFSMEQAVKFAYRHTEKGKICLLSCASPSYSLWKNFEEKGDLFKRSVRKYSK